MQAVGLLAVTGASAGVSARACSKMEVAGFGVSIRGKAGVLFFRPRGCMGGVLVVEFTDDGVTCSRDEAEFDEAHCGGEDGAGL